MEGVIRTVSSDDQHRRHLQQKKKKQEWRNLFVKLDDISARLIAFSDRSQFEVCWSVQLVGADISTPVPGEPSYGIDVDDTPFCFYVRETSVAKDGTRRNCLAGAQSSSHLTSCGTRQSAVGILDHLLMSGFQQNGRPSSDEGVEHLAPVF
jgi:hypothetical protein